MVSPPCCRPIWFPFYNEWTMTTNTPVYIKESKFEDALTERFLLWWRTLDNGRWGHQHRRFARRQEDRAFATGHRNARGVCVPKMSLGDTLGQTRFAMLKIYLQSLCPFSKYCVQTVWRFSAYFWEKCFLASSISCTVSIVPTYCPCESWTAW